jgi:hypothetical protein
MRLSVEKTVCSGFWVQKHAAFSPASTLEGEQLCFSPSNARLLPRALCLPFSDAQTRPATKGAYPLDLCPLSRLQIRQSLLGFRLRSPLPFVEEPCPLRLQTVFYTQKPSQNKNTNLAGAKAACFRSTQSDLQYILLTRI